MPAPARKRARKATPEPEPAPEASTSAAPHLVSFLTGYAERADESGSEGEGSGSASEGEPEEPDELDDEEEAPHTPSKRVGLVGTPSRRKRGTPATTPRKPRTPGTARKTKPVLQPGDDGYIRPSRADAYFMAASRGAKTSGQSYASLAAPLSQAEYEATAVGARGVTPRVKGAIEDAEAYFPQWEAELEAGFNLLLYGFGSKRRLVNRFVARLGERGHCAVVNGYFPGLNLRDVLASLEDSLSIPDAPAPPGATPLERAAHRLYAHFSTEGANPLFLVLHNIDAPALKATKAMAVLSLLACSPGIHIVATFDHVNTPLLFSATATATPPHPWRKPRTRRKGDEYIPVPASRGFNWVYHSIATYDDYDVELAYARLSASAIGALGQGGQAGVSEEGALQILRSVPPMAARLLKLILSRQLGALPPDPATHVAHPPAATAPSFAMDVDLVQKTARDRFIAREEDRFNALLGEFRDHGLVVVAELDPDGRTGRWAWVPLGKSAIERILDEMKDVET
jgi:origin recognition complex subunit 2